MGRSTSACVITHIARPCTVSYPPAKMSLEWKHALVKPSTTCAIGRGHVHGQRSLPASGYHPSSYFKSVFLSLRTELSTLWLVRFLLGSASVAFLGVAGRRVERLGRSSGFACSLFSSLLKSVRSWALDEEDRRAGGSKECIQPTASSTPDGTRALAFLSAHESSW
ncbi:hypothetical protein PGT21_011193 [Puccinia graminis f. sp. tritici]|uniref:Uncharacterized protein n=1 Tax=Puccinia graminis f. sp. tritici TaxID=56615 RepID=A0A5B0M9V7_PUCGR|nr:hypothetical protein PGT21_011193 [Puccinia graminis f. sp. tritici]